MSLNNFLGCPYCGTRLSNVIERPATEAERQDVTLHAIRDRCYVPFRPVAVGLGSCERHGLLRVRRLRQVTDLTTGPGGAT